MTHGSFVLFSKKQLTFPKSEDRVLFERGHETNDFVAREERHLPLDCFFHIWTRAVNEPTNVFQNRLSEWPRILDVGVDPRILLHDSY
jgi:hypothetical protein